MNNTFSNALFQAININHIGVVRENESLILSCVARGTRNISFRWYKDKMFINVTESTK